MEAKSSKKVKLENLPGSEDKEFWGDAEIHTGIVPQKINNDEHYFVRLTGREAECLHCNWGFALDPGDKIIDGKLYDKNGKFIA